MNTQTATTEQYTFTQAGTSSETDTCTMLMSFEEGIAQAFGKKPSRKLWQTIEAATQDLSDIMTTARCHYRNRVLKRSDPDVEVTEAFEKAASVLAEELFAVSAMASFWAEAERCEAKNLAELKVMFDAEVWGRGAESFNTMGRVILGDTESND